MPEIQYYSSNWEVSDALQGFYTPYASYVIQTRALPDARDGLKTGARFILYSQYKDKLTIKNKRRKAVATVSAAMRFSPHGDSSILGTAVRLSQDFSMRYPVIEVQGNNGSYLAGDDYSQARYLEMRGNDIAYEMTYLLEKNTVDKWKMNYTNEEEYPTYLPSKFPFALVNGSFGIGVACASSVPPHNLVDVCNAAVTLINKPNASFEEIYCPIDFPSGGTIINEDAVKESLKNGSGKAALIRASIEYNSDENELIVYEMPYMTFTGNVVSTISKIIEDGTLTGVSSVIDGTDFDGPKIFIKLNKGANVSKVIRLLYKHTPLQNSYSINMNMLENGVKPKLYTWKEQLETYLYQLKDIIIKSYQFDLKKLLDRIHILEGLIIAFNNIENVVKDIRNSTDSFAAKNKLMNNYNLSEIQSDAILKMKLSGLTHLEIEKLEKEKNEKITKANKIKEILSSEEKIKQEMIKDISSISKKYGDVRKTKNINLDFTSEEDDAEPIEEKELLIYYTNHNNIYTQESTTLMTTRRGRKGSKVKLGKNEVIVQTINDNNLSELLTFTNTGKMYSTYTSELPINAKINCSQLFELEDGEYITTLTTMERKEKAKYLIFVTKNGIIKKTKTSEYQKKRGKSLKAINLKDNDEVLNVYPMNNEKIGFLTSDGNCIIIETENISPIGRAAAGVKGIKLNDGAQVIDSQIIENQDKFLIAVSKKGYIKKMNLSDIGVATRGTKGKKIQKLDDDDMTVKMLTINTDRDIIINTKGRVIKINSSEISLLSRDAAGTKSMNLEENEQIQDMLIS